MASRSHSHSVLPAPAPNAIISISQSKSHVLAGVQDAYWSDDETEDAECPLCLEEMDISDVNFKPCVCGYQICRFCWHHIKENLNGRCPACRREYSDEMVEFKPIAPDDHKRLTQQKKRRERERKELDALGRRHLANLRVVQRNVVYVVGIGPRFAKEELIPTLRSSDYFGQYGKISKILLVKRTPSGGGAPIVGLYITFHRREDAARTIGAVDGAPSPSGGREVMRASYGTTKYCMSFLRSQPCGDHSCKNLHEWGDEKDCFTKEDLTTLKHTIKDTENRRATKKSEEADGLPRTAAWGSKPISSVHAMNQSSISSTHRQPRRGTSSRHRNIPPGLTEPRFTSRPGPDRKIPSTVKSPSQGSSSRPSTPSFPLPQRPATPADVKALRQKDSTSVRRPRSPTSSAAMESDVGSGPVDSSPASPTRVQQLAAPVQPAAFVVPPGFSTVPSAPPGILAPSRPPRIDSTSPQTPLLALQSSYQMSSAARALLDELKGRRDGLAPSTTISPFPDLDRTLQTLSGEGSGESGGFSFNLDPKLVIPDEVQQTNELPGFEAGANSPFHSSYLDSFPTLSISGQVQSATFMTPSTIPYSLNSARSIYDPLSIRVPPVEKQTPSASSYTGTFNPFADTNEAVSSRRPQPSPLDDDSGRKMSRFGFAQGRRGSTTTSSPLHMPSSLSNNESHFSFFNAPEIASAPAQWSPLGHQLDYAYSQTASAIGTPLMQHAQAQAAYAQHQSRFQPFDTGVSESQLRDLIQPGFDRGTTLPMSRSTDVDSAQYKFPQVRSQQFHDPAIMVASFASPAVPSASSEGIYAGPTVLDNGHYGYGPPPGLVFPPPSSASAQVQPDRPQPNGLAHVPTPPSPPPLSASDFPALVPEHPVLAAEDASTGSVDSKTQLRLERKAAAAEKAAERVKAAQEKAAAKMAEKARLLAEKASEKRRSATAEKEKEKERKEKEKKDKEKEKEKAQPESSAPAVREKLDRKKMKTEKEVKERLVNEREADVEKGKQEKEKPKDKKKERGREKEKERQKDGDEKEERREAEELEETEKGKEKEGKRKVAAQVGEETSVQTKKGKQASAPKPNSGPKASVAAAALEVVTQVPLLSKKPRKNKAISSKPIRTSKDEPISETTVVPRPPSPSESATAVKGPATNESSATNSRSPSVDLSSAHPPASIVKLLEEIAIQNPGMNLPNHPFFDPLRINPAAKMPLEYGPLVHALSALSIGGSSFANNMPSGSIDNAVSSFQQLLETLTQTISDLLRLLPRTTWDDSSSFDGVLRDMLKGDDFLDEGSVVAPGAGGGTGGAKGAADAPVKEDEVAALTLALERRARWMEVQLSKLEELHRDINTAAVRAVLACNDEGWDSHGHLPRAVNSLRRFDKIGLILDDEKSGVIDEVDDAGAGEYRPMNVDELEKKLTVAKEAAAFAEMEVREMMEKMQTLRPVAIEI